MVVKRTHRCMIQVGAGNLSPIPEAVSLGEEKQTEHHVGVVGSVLRIPK